MISARDWLTHHAMFSDFVRLISRRPPDEYEQGFVREVNVRQKAPRNARVERMLKLGWALIAVKSLAVVWLFERYHIQINALWIILPTVAFGCLCTLVYLLRD